MRGIAVDAKRFRYCRLAKSLTQRELAVIAGVGERTVRNAESGKRVRVDFLGFLAQALEVEPCDLAQDRDELRVAMREQRRVDHLMTALEALGRHDMSEYASLAASSVQIRYPGPEDLPLSGEFRGVDGMQRLIDQSRESIIYERPSHVEEIRSSGNLVVISGQDCLRAAPTQKLFTTWWHHIYEFERGKIVRIDALANLPVIIDAFRPE